MLVNMLTVFGCVTIASDRQKVLAWQASLLYHRILHEPVEADITWYFWHIFITICA